MRSPSGTFCGSSPDFLSDTIKRQIRRKSGGGGKKKYPERDTLASWTSFAKISEARTKKGKKVRGPEGLQDKKSGPLGRAVAPHKIWGGARKNTSQSKGDPTEGKYILPSRAED